MFSTMVSSVLLLMVLLFSNSVWSTSVSGGVDDVELCRAVDVCMKRLDLGKKCRILPVPKKAFVPPFAPGTFRLVPLRQGVWAYNDGVYLSLILKKNGRLAIVDIADSGNSNKPDGSQTRFTDAAEMVLDGMTPKRIDIVYSHAHMDHIGATTRFLQYAKKKYPRAKIMVWGTEEAKQLVLNSRTGKAPIPDVIIGKRGRTISLGKGLDVKMTIVGGHTENDLVLYIPRSQKEKAIVYYVDVVFPGWSPPFNLAITTDVGRYIQAQKEILKLDFQVFVGGHFLLGDRGSVATNVEFAEDLVEAAKTALAETTQEDFAALGIDRYSDPDAREYGNALFFLTRVFRQAQIDTCYRIMLEKWGCRVAGLDISGKGHCFTAITYIATDY